LTENRVKTGIKGLDEMLRGGLFKGSTTALRGAPGTGKTSLGLEFIARGVSEFGQPGLIITFEEFSENLENDAASIGFDLNAMRETGKLHIMMSSPATFMREMAAQGGKFDEIIVKNGIERVFIDSLGMLYDYDSDTTGRGATGTLIHGLKRYGITSVLAEESLSIMGETDVSDSRLAYVVDNVILLSYVEMNSRLKKSVLVLKERGSGHDMEIREFEITGRGMSIKTPFSGTENIMVGNARQIANELREFFDE
jgi:circadian clock protein KaiC